MALSGLVGKERILAYRYKDLILLKNLSGKISSCRGG